MYWGSSPERDTRASYIDTQSGMTHSAPRRETSGNEKCFKMFSKHNKEMANPTGKKWVYTLNNYSEEEYKTLQEYDAIWHIIGKEVGKSGTPHLQGHIILEKETRFNTVRKMLFNKAHVERQRGRNEEAAAYCRKDGKYWEKGALPQDRYSAGDREKKRWEEARELSKRGRFEEVDARIYMRHYKTMEYIYSKHKENPKILTEMPGVWIYGPQGVFKNSYCLQAWPDAFKKRVHKWWDGYQDQDVVVLHDLDMCMPKEFSHEIKIWVDAEPFFAEVKGGGRFIRPKKFVVTSNFSITELFGNGNPVTLEAIKRRFPVVLHFDSADTAKKYFRELPSVQEGQIQHEHIRNFLSE